MEKTINPKKWCGLIETNCPFQDSEFHSCNLDKSIDCPQEIEDEDDWSFNQEIPENCPLKKGEVTIKLGEIIEE